MSFVPVVIRRSTTYIPVERIRIPSDYINVIVLFSLTDSPIRVPLNSSRFTYEFIEPYFEGTEGTKISFSDIKDDLFKMEEDITKKIKCTLQITIKRRITEEKYRAIKIKTIE